MCFSLSSSQARYKILAVSECQQKNPEVGGVDEQSLGPGNQILFFPVS